MRTKRLSKSEVVASIAGLVIMAIIICLAKSDHKNFEQATVSQAQQQLLMIAKSTARSLEEFIEEHSEALQILSHSPSFQEEIYRKTLHDKPDSGYCPTKSFYDIHKDDVDALAILDADGIMLHRHPFIADRPGMDHADKPGVDHVIKEHKPHVSEVFCNNLGKPSISISEPVFYKGEFAGIIRWMIQIATIYKRFIEPIKVGKKSYAILLDDKGRFLCHPNMDSGSKSFYDALAKIKDDLPDHDWSGLKKMAAERSKGKEGVSIVYCPIREKEGANKVIKRMAGYSPIRIGNRTWSITVNVPYSEIAGPINRHARNTFGLAGFVILAFGAGGVVLFRTREKKTRLETETRYLKEVAGSAEAMKASEEKLAGIVDSVTDHMSMMDEQHAIVWANDVAKSLFGEDLIGKKCYAAYHGRDKVCRPCIVSKCFKDGKSHHHETEVIAADGNKMTFWCTASMAARHEDGRPKTVVEVSRDITEYKRLKAQLFHAQKMEAIGALAGGVAHDFNNILTVIQGNAQLMSMDLDPANPHYELVKEIEGRVKVASNLTQQLLGFARGGKYEVKPINLNDAVRESSTAFGRTKKEIAIHPKFGEDLPPIEADIGQIEQVLMNLYVNAAHAMPDGGDLYLETRAITQEDIQGKPFRIEPCSYILLSVTDTGVGMDKETRERIFDPFFTTREMGRGTGLGLASVYGIIKAHKGYIDIESEKGQGTTFKIYLPISKREVEKIASVTDKIINGTETILLVDDEEPVLKLGVRVLNRSGYTVLEAKNGREAVDIYQTNRDKIDMVILDMIMPDMGGGKTYDLLKQINPDIKVLLSSGYSADGRATEILKQGCNGFIQKPFDMEVLSHKIREVLEP